MSGRDWGSVYILKSIYEGFFFFTLFLFFVSSKNFKNVFLPFFASCFSSSHSSSSSSSSFCFSSIFLFFFFFLSLDFHSSSFYPSFRPFVWSLGGLTPKGSLLATLDYGCQLYWQHYWLNEAICWLSVAICNAWGQDPGNWPNNWSGHVTCNTFL